MTSRIRSWAKPFLTGSMTWRPTPAGSTSAPTTTPPPSPWIDPPLVEQRRGGRLPVARRGCWSPRTRAGPTGTAPGRGKPSWPHLPWTPGLSVTVCHFPPGTSKWNKIEHRLFSHITLNWRGRPLTSHEVIVNTIAATTTRTGGYGCTPQLDPGSYPDGVKVSDEQMACLPLNRHGWHGDWNYTLRPEPPAPPSPPRPPAREPERPGLGTSGTDRPERRRWDHLIAALVHPLSGPARSRPLHRPRGPTRPQARHQAPARAHPRRADPDHHSAPAFPACPGPNSPNCSAS